MNTPLTAILKSSERAAAENLIESMQRTSRVIAREFAHNVRILWDHPNPQGVLDELDAMGIRADFVFNESAKLAEYLSDVAARNQDVELGALVQAAVASVRPTAFDPETGKGTIVVPEPEN